MSWFFGSGKTQQTDNDYKLRLAAAENEARLSLTVADNALKERLAAADNALKERLAAGENMTKQRVAGMLTFIFSLFFRSSNLPNPEIHASRKEIMGGTGGKGGRSATLGGGGGIGEASRLTFEEAASYHIVRGGTGGEGGEGGDRGGDGGIGRGQSFEKPLVPPVNGEVPHLTTAQFCEQYRLSPHIRKLLIDGGYETAEGTSQRNQYRGCRAGPQNWTHRGVDEGLEEICGHAREIVPSPSQHFFFFSYVYMQTFFVEYISMRLNLLRKQ
ncbi:hypothetical protein MSAN_00213300 [Mycena sanguinolenta]|uniref:Uncharacterized protein n=1 Tax=Mycena sanguinolenta TaxID=230812 RepID=A0A8H6ZJ62_9AGAR|nr:hypothetical protein MSAN_00213300 [Mycena sanguinolenta]